MGEEKITFAVLYLSSDNRSESFELLEYDTVEILKVTIHSLFDIPPHKQIIEGWTNPPEGDQTILQCCSRINRINYLTLKHLDTLQYFDDNNTNSLEIEAAQSCFKQICTDMSTSHVHFNMVSLSTAIETVLLVPKEKRKALILYMHNSEHLFSKQFLKLINCQSISEILIKSFFFVGWDLSDKKYHESLCKALTEADIAHLSNFVETGMCATIIIQNIHGQIKVMAVLIENITESEFLHYLNNSQDFIIADSKEKPKNETDEKEEMNSKAFQKLMADRLGDRDYDCYTFKQHEYLKENIGYALFGPPQKETGYDDKELTKIKKIYETIVKHNEKIAEYKDQVELSCIFNCMEPLPKDKASRLKKNPQYNPNTDIIPVPLFVLRKCRESEDPCRIFIDDIGRKYESWKEYIEENKLDKCIMVLPEKGRYKVIGDEVMLERHNSPACSPIKTVLQVGDIASTVGSVGSGTVMLAAGATAVTTIAVAPVAVITAGVVGAGAGVYALARSIAYLVDRVKRDESLSFANSEARGIYFNLLAGSLGFVGAGASMAVSQLAANGVNIGKGVGAAVNTIGVANIGVSGASIANSSYDVFDQWYNQNQTPSLLTMVQLGSSVLFFGNAVYNFKTCQTIVDEAQARVLQDYSESLRSNRHRKTFNKMMKETIRQNDGNKVRGRAEVIKTIRNVPNKDEVFAVLTRSNKEMNRKGVKFFASEGKITLNGQTINMNEFIGMNKQEASAFLSNLPMKTDISAAETANLISRFSLDKWSIPNVSKFAEYAIRLIGNFGLNIQGMLLEIVHDLIPILMETFKTILDKIFPDNSVTIKLLCMIMEYFGGKAYKFLENFKKWRQTGSYNYYNEDFGDVPENKNDQYTWIFVKLVKMCFNGGHINEYDMKDIIRFAEKYIINEIMENEKKEDEKQKIEEHSPNRPQKVECTICSGYYFKSSK